MQSKYFKILDNTVGGFPLGQYEHIYLFIFKLCRYFWEVCTVVLSSVPWACRKCINLTWQPLISCISAATDMHISLLMQLGYEISILHPENSYYRMDSIGWMSFAHAVEYIYVHYDKLPINPSVLTFTICFASCIVRWCGCLRISELFYLVVLSSLLLFA